MSRDYFKNLSKIPLSNVKKIIFGAGSPIFTKCLNEIRRQLVNDEIVYIKKLLEDKERRLTWDNMAVDDAIMID